MQLMPTVVTANCQYCKLRITASWQLGLTARPIYKLWIASEKERKDFGFGE